MYLTDLGMKILISRLYSQTNEDELDATLQVTLHAVESSASYQNFIAYGGLFATVNLLSTTSSPKVRVLALKCIQQFLYKGEPTRP
jgi:hypothetical protein